MAVSPPDPLPSLALCHVGGHLPSTTSSGNSPEVPLCLRWEHKRNLTPHVLLLRRPEQKAGGTATHTGLCGFPQASQAGSVWTRGLWTPPQLQSPGPPSPLPAWPPPPARPLHPVLHTRSPGVLSHPKSHYREAVRQTVKGLGFGVTVIRGCGPFVHGVNLGKWLKLPRPWFSHLHNGDLRSPSSRGRQEGVMQVKSPSIAPGASYQITAGVLEDCACPAQLGCPSFLWGIPSSTQACLVSVDSIPN